MRSLGFDGVCDVGFAGDHGMHQRLRSLSCFLTLAVLAVCSTDAVARASHKSQSAKKPHEATGVRCTTTTRRSRNAGHAKHVVAVKHKSRRSRASASECGGLSPVRRSCGGQAGDRSGAQGQNRRGYRHQEYDRRSGGPETRRMVHPATPRDDANFSRYAAFIADNPDWPSMGLMRRRAEARLWQQRATLPRFAALPAISRQAPRAALRLRGCCLPKATATAPDDRFERPGGRRNCRSALKPRRSRLFRDLLTREDHRARMDKRIGAKDFSGAKRAAQRLGSDDLSIVKACAAVAANATKALDLLDAVASRGPSGSGLRAMPYSLDAASRSNRGRNPPDAGGRAADHGASGHGRMVARAAQSRPQAARSG